MLQIPSFHHFLALQGTSVSHFFRISLLVTSSFHFSSSENVISSSFLRIFSLSLDTEFAVDDSFLSALKNSVPLFLAYMVSDEKSSVI